ncbi:plasmid stabilization protein, partial [Klebsiella pneumoniae]|nr:plasmid stabilization protein [Klebsiella pneumoniae]
RSPTRAAPAKAPEPPASVSESVSARNLAGSLPD